MSTTFYQFFSSSDLPLKKVCKRWHSLQRVSLVTWSIMAHGIWIPPSPLLFSFFFLFKPFGTCYFSVYLVSTKTGTKQQSSSYLCVYLFTLFIFYSFAVKPSRINSSGLNSFCCEMQRSKCFTRFNRIPSLKSLWRVRCIVFSCTELGLLIKDAAKLCAWTCLDIPTGPWPLSFKDLNEHLVVLVSWCRTGPDDQSSG